MSRRRVLLAVVVAAVGVVVLTATAVAAATAGTGPDADTGDATGDAEEPVVTAPGGDPQAPAVGPAGFSGAAGAGSGTTYAGGPPAPALVGSGADALLQAPRLAGDNGLTVRERYGTQGYSLDQQLGAGSATDRALNALAGGVFAIAAWIALAVVAVVQWAFTVELFSFVGEAVGGVVSALRDTIYAPFLTVAVAVAGAWATWHGLVRRRGTRALEGLVWVAVALTAAAVFFGAPGALLDAANTVSTEVSRASLAAVSAADPGDVLGGGPADEATFHGNAADQQLRRAGDRFWRVFVHQPWLVLQFGDPEVGAGYGQRLLDAKTVTSEEIAAAGGGDEALERVIREEQEAYLAVQEEVLADPRAATWFRGQRAVARVGLATLALVGVVLGGVLMAAVAVALLLAQVGVLLLVLLAPLALLVGLHPGAGRLLAVRWAELALGLLLKRVALGALLAVVLVVNGVLLAAASDLGWLVATGLQTLVVAAAVVYRRPLLRLAAPTTVPVLHRRDQADSGDRHDRGQGRGDTSLDRRVHEPPRLAPFTVDRRSPAGRRPRAPQRTTAGATPNGTEPDTMPGLSPSASRRVRRDRPGGEPDPAGDDDASGPLGAVAAFLRDHLTASTADRRPASATEPGEPDDGHADNAAAGNGHHPEPVADNGHYPEPDGGNGHHPDDGDRGGGVW